MKCKNVREDAKIFLDNELCEKYLIKYCPMEEQDTIIQLYIPQNELEGRKDIRIQNKDETEHTRKGALNFFGEFLLAEKVSQLKIGDRVRITHQKTKALLCSSPHSYSHKNGSNQQIATCTTNDEDEGTKKKKKFIK